MRRRPQLLGEWSGRQGCHEGPPGLEALVRQEQTVRIETFSHWPVGTVVYVPGIVVRTKMENSSLCDEMRILA